jgi:hypothetical protein
MFVSCECCVSSGRGLCDGLIIHSEEAYRLCECVIVCDLETSRMRRPRPELGCCATGKKSCITTERALCRFGFRFLPKTRIPSHILNSLS